MGFLPTGSASEDPAGSHQRHFGDHGGLQGQRPKVLRVQVVDVGFAAGPGQHLDLRVHGLEEVGHPSAASSMGKRATSSGSWVVIPTGQSPVWQWWQEYGSVPNWW